MPGGKVVFTVNEMSFQINQILYDEIQWNNLRQMVENLELKNIV